MKRIAYGYVTLALAALLGVARAEAPPTPGAETCTLESQRRPGEECLVCDAWQGDSAKCLKRLSSKGYQRRCRGGGDAMWPEVWCRAAAPTGKPKP